MKDEADLNPAHLESDLQRAYDTIPSEDDTMWIYRASILLMRPMKCRYVQRAATSVLLVFAGMIAIVSIASRGTGGRIDLFGPAGLVLLATVAGFGLFLWNMHLDETLRLRPAKCAALRRIGYPVCVECGYDLRGLESGDCELKVCPECGADSDAMQAIGTVTLPDADVVYRAKKRAHASLGIHHTLLAAISMGGIVGFVYFTAAVSKYDPASTYPPPIWKCMGAVLSIGIPAFYGTRVYSTMLYMRNCLFLRMEGFNICTKCGYLMDDPKKADEATVDLPRANCPVCQTTHQEMIASVNSKCSHFTAISGKIPHSRHVDAETIIY